MLKGMISSIATGLASGGTVDGDLVVTGDFKVEGAGSFVYDEIVQGNIAIQETGSLSARLIYRDTDDAKLWTIGVARTTNDIETGTVNLDLVHASEYASNIIFANKPTESMRITSAGSVGIGTSSPSYKFVVNEASDHARMQIQTGSVNHQTFLHFQFECKFKLEV